MSHLQPLGIPRTDSIRPVLERAFPSMLRNKVKSQEANVVCFCIETHDIRCLRITPCRAFVR
jgi:hypothetical protein